MKHKFLKCLAMAVAVPAIILSGCTNSSSSQNEYYFDKLGGGQESSTEIDSVDEGVIDGAITNQMNSVDLTEEQEKVSVNSYTESFDGSTATTPIEISAAGDYYFTGNFTISKTDGNAALLVIAKNSGNVHLYFNNATFSSTCSNDGTTAEGDECNKVLSIKGKNTVTITLSGTNSITNSGIEDNVISSKVDLTINGSGSLSVSSTKSGIKTDGTYYGLGGNVTISAEKHAVTADSIYIDGEKITVSACGGDGLHAESDYDDWEDDSNLPVFSYSKGYVYIAESVDNSTKVDISGCEGDGIQADSFVNIIGGDIDIDTTAAEPVSYTATASGESGCYSKSGSVYTKVATDNVRAGSTYYKLEQSAKGIKVGEIDYTKKDDETEYYVSSTNYAILISGGTVNVSSIDDTIHANSGMVKISGGTVEVSSRDDGLHADTDLIVAGGTINVTSSYEGFEGQAIEISGGTSTIIASDDGINAANSDLSTNAQTKVCQILISGGKTYLSASGDGVDSNGGIKITGGELYVSGPTSNGDAALDSENGIVITGGTVIAIGSSGMVETPSTSSTQCAIAINFSGSKSGVVTIKNSNNEVIASFDPSIVNASGKTYSSIVVSCAGFSKGASYTIVTGSSSTTVTTNSSSTITTSGSNVGGMIPNNQPGRR